MEGGDNLSSKKGAREIMRGRRGAAAAISYCLLKYYFFYIFYLDSLEAFFVNSYQNGATSWIPKELPPNVRIVVAINSGNGGNSGKSGSGTNREVQRSHVHWSRSHSWSLVTDFASLLVTNTCGHL